jgi:hypothetical protein
VELVSRTGSDIFISYFNPSLNHDIRSDFLRSRNKYTLINRPMSSCTPRIYLDYDGYTTPVACMFSSGSVKVSLLKSALYRSLVLGGAASFLRFRFPFFVSFNGSGRTLVAGSLIYSGYY